MTRDSTRPQRRARRASSPARRRRWRGSRAAGPGSGWRRASPGCGPRRHGARVQTARARVGEVRAGAPLDNGHVDPYQRQLARHHQPRRAAADYHHRMVGHTPPFRDPGLGSVPRAHRARRRLRRRRDRPTRIPTGVNHVMTRCAPGSPRIMRPLLTGTRVWIRGTADASTTADCADQGLAPD